MKVLQFYTATGMRDAEKVGSWDALLTPNWKFLPFQIQRSHLADTYLTAATIVDCSGTDWDVFGAFRGAEDLVTDWENGPHPTYSFTTFADSGGNILTAIESSSDNSFCYSDAFSLATGEAIVVSYNLTLNSGSLPNIYLGEFTGPSLFSAKQTAAAGGDIIQLTATGNTSGDVRLMLENEAGNDTSFACSFTYVKRTTLKIVEKTSYDFITYNGEPFSEEIQENPAAPKYSILPYGVYYLKLSDGRTDWFSEWFSVENIQPQLITGWSTETYDTFTLSGVNITSAINLAGGAIARTNSFKIRVDEIFVFTYDLTLNSGESPTVRLLIDGKVRSNNVTLSLGLNEAELTSFGFSESALLDMVNTSASNYSLGSVSLRRKSGEYVHLEFTNARDFNNTDESIYYVGGWTQQAYLRAYENVPSHEIIEEGGNKNGVFVPEKMVSKYTRSVVSYESRSMYNAIRLLPLHGTIKILTEDGVEYTPAAGNVEVPRIDWNTFDTGTLRILWNETGQQWTNSMDNIT